MSSLATDLGLCGTFFFFFILRSPKAIHLLPGEHGEILGKLEVGWEKVTCWSTKAAISLKHVKIDKKLLWRLEDL